MRFLASETLWVVRLMATDRGGHPLLGLLVQPLLVVVPTPLDVAIGADNNARDQAGEEDRG